MKATAVGITQQAAPVDAQEIISRANTGLDITIANIVANEFCDLEKRRQTLEQAPPTFSDIVDPATNVVSTAVKNDVEKGFSQQRRAGSGGSRPWRLRGGRKTYMRGKAE